MTCATTLPSAPALVYTAAKPRGPVLVTPHSEAVQTPTDKRGFVMPKLRDAAPICSLPMVSGVGSAYPQGQRQGFGLVTTPHAHHFRPSQARGGSLVTPEGAKTMTHVTQGRTTPTPATSATHHHTTEERRAFAALEAANCAALARWYSARGNVKAARRKAVQLLAALAVFSFHHDSSTELRWTTPKPDAAGLSIT